MDITTLSKKNKRVLILVFSLLFVLAIGGIAVAFSLNYNTFMPAAPYILDDGNSVLITTSLNENYKGYSFKFQSLNNEVVIKSKNNVLTEEDLVESDLIVGTTYKVSVRYVGETENDGTDYGGSVNWMYSVSLKSPVVTLNSAARTIDWQPVEHADYYIVHYKNGHTYQTHTTITQSYDYSAWTGGAKEVYVTAHSYANGYKTSSNSQIISFVHKQSLKEIKAQNISFNPSTCYLTVKAEEELQYLKIHINANEYIAKLPKVDKSNGYYTYNINIVTKYEDGAEIGVEPYPADEYYSFDGNTTYLS